MPIQSSCMKNRILRLLGVLVPVAVIISLWIPPLTHYWVSTPLVNRALESRLRNVPADSLLLEIERQSLALQLRITDPEILEAAARLRSGELWLKGYAPIAVSPRFDKEDLRKGLPTWGLHFGSLAAAQIFAQAYELSGDKTWLSAALQYTLSFIEYERGAWLPEGFLWNDHAIAGRISVLVRLWRLYRKQPDYSEDIGRLLIEHVLRCRGFLGKKSHFTFSTNHGVMQNVSLLQIAAAFPGLPEEDRYRELAIQRLDRQFGFYFSDEGVVLEHSAEYHLHGLHLIGMATRLLQIVDQPVPSRWSSLHRRAGAFLDVIQLPDDSLPMFGNTNSNSEFPLKGAGLDPRKSEAAKCDDKQGTHVYPVAGYAVIWNCGKHVSQTVMAWSQFVGHGHKHADELSLLTWARGTRWLTSVGYWPYGVTGDKHAYGWEGSNAPHWVGETAVGERSPLLIASGASNGLTFLDARRSAGGGTEFRRQVLQVGEDWLVVLDFLGGPAKAQAEVLWTFFPGITLNPQGGNTYLASAGDSEMLVNIGVGTDANHHTVIAEQSPWRGWVVKDRVPTPAEAILVHFSGTTYPLVSSFHIADKGKADGINVEMVAFRGPEDWELTIDNAGNQKSRITRRPNGQITLTGMDTVGETILTIQVGHDVIAERTAIRAAYSSLEADFPRYREVSFYRYKVTKLLLAVLVLQELLLVLIWMYRRRLLPVFQLSAIVAWSGTGIALQLWYFP
jgi:hypothetical protein